MIEIGYETPDGFEHEEIGTADLKVDFKSRVVRITENSRTTYIPFERVYYWEADDTLDLSLRNSVSEETVPSTW